MDKIPYINIADTNIWMIYLMPFLPEERTDYKIVNDLQQECIENKIFGMGWDNYFVKDTTEETNKKVIKMTDENIEEHFAYDTKENSVLKAVERYKEIKKGDYVITRRKNSHYYVGKVSSDGAFYIHKPEAEKDSPYKRFSWGGTVEKWVEYSNDGEVPSEIVGRFSQRFHPTIQRIAQYRPRLLVISMYERSLAEEDRIFNVPKLHIGLNNFARSLNYMELEDLVSLYITDKHYYEGYRLLPSSCKVSQQNYEFRFVAKGKKPITCQVKNQKEIEIGRYKDEKSYAKIYLFSGSGEYDDVEKTEQKSTDDSHIHIISPEELYEVLIANNIFESKYYDFNSNTPSLEELPLEGYNRREKRLKSETDYMILDEFPEDFVYFLAKKNFFYSVEFGALILLEHVMKEDLDREDFLIKKVHSDLNR